MASALVKVKIEDLTEADVKEINYACAAHVARCIKEARDY
jgi:hypothetical protein